MTLISVIVPVYNAEKYLEQCIRSVIDQTYTKWEMILINDGSRDSSLEICRNFERTEKRITVLNQENRGVSAARKGGRENSKGDYLFFLDSDDWLVHDALEAMINFSEENDLDIVSIGYYKEYPHKSIVAKPLGKTKIFPQAEYLKRLIGPTGKYLNTPHKFDAFSSMKKLYRDRLFDNPITFIDAKDLFPGEDTYFNIQAACFAENIGHLEVPLYHYRRGNEDSATGGYKPGYMKNWFNRYDHYRELLDKLNISDEMQGALNNRICCEFISVGLREANPASPKPLRERIDFLSRLLNKKIYREAFSNLSLSQMPLHWKIYFKACRKGNGAVVYFLSLLMRKIRKQIPV